MKAFTILAAVLSASFALGVPHTHRETRRELIARGKGGEVHGDSHPIAVRPRPRPAAEGGSGSLSGDALRQKLITLRDTPPKDYAQRGPPSIRDATGRSNDLADGLSEFMRQGRTEGKSNLRIFYGNDNPHMASAREYHEKANPKMKDAEYTRGKKTDPDGKSKSRKALERFFNFLTTGKRRSSSSRQKKALSTDQLTSTVHRLPTGVRASHDAEMNSLKQEFWESGSTISFGSSRSSAARSKQPMPVAPEAGPKLPNYPTPKQDRSGPGPKPQIKRRPVPESNRFGSVEGARMDGPKDFDMPADMSGEGKAPAPQKVPDMFDLIDQHGANWLDHPDQAHLPDRMKIKHRRAAHPKRDASDDLSSDESNSGGNTASDPGAAAKAKADAASAEFQDVLNAFSATQANISNALFPWLDAMLDGSNSTLLYDAAWSLFADMTGQPIHVIGPFTHGLNCLDFLEDQLFAANGTLNATLTSLDNNSTSDAQPSDEDLAMLEYLAVHEVLLEMYEYVWENGAAAVNSTGALADLAMLQGYLLPNDTSVATSGFFERAETSEWTPYFTNYNFAVDGGGVGLGNVSWVK